MTLWNQWLIHQPSREIYTKFRHFEFEEDISVRPIIQHELATLVYDYHIRSKSGMNLLPQLGYRQVAKAIQVDQRPKNLSNTQKAHLIEILACEFARSYLGYDIPVFRFHYNPNSEQSMKGDDILGFSFSSTNNVIIGEAKYRKTFSNDVVELMYNSFSQTYRPHPISLEFFATILDIEGDTPKAQKIRQVRKQLHSYSPLVQRNYLLVLASEGKPTDPFKAIQSQNNVLENLTVVNIVFQKNTGIDQWIDSVYKLEI